MTRRRAPQTSYTLRRKYSEFHERFHLNSLASIQNISATIVVEVACEKGPKLDPCGTLLHVTVCNYFEKKKNDTARFPEVIAGMLIADSNTWQQCVKLKKNQNSILWLSKSHD